MIIQATTPGGATVYWRGFGEWSANKRWALMMSDRVLRRELPKAKYSAQYPGYRNVIVVRERRNPNRQNPAPKASDQMKNSRYYKEVASLLHTFKKHGIKVVGVNDGDRVIGTGKEHPASVILSVDESWIYVLTPNGKKKKLYAVLGNGPGELIADYSMDPHLDRAVEEHYSRWESRRNPNSIDRFNKGWRKRPSRLSVASSGEEDVPNLGTMHEIAKILKGKVEHMGYGSFMLRAYRKKDGYNQKVDLMYFEAGGAMSRDTEFGYSYAPLRFESGATKADIKKVRAFIRREFPEATDVSRRPNPKGRRRGKARNNPPQLVAEWRNRKRRTVGRLYSYEDGGYSFRGDSGGGVHYGSFENALEWANRRVRAEGHKSAKMWSPPPTTAASGGLKRGDSYARYI